MSVKLEVAQVLQTWEPTQFKKTKDQFGLDLPPGTIRVRTGEAGGGGEERYAFPADPNRMPIPLYGEQVLLLNQPDGKGTGRGQDIFYYISTINTHGSVNNGILPFLQDATLGGVSSTPTAIVATGQGQMPRQWSWKEFDTVYMQPFQGDINIPCRHGSILRFSSTHLAGETIPYQKKPFFTGTKKNDPFVSLTCGVDDARKGRSVDKYYAIEDPNKDNGFIYLTSSQKFMKMKLAQPKVGKDVEKLNVYVKPQVIIGSDRLIFNARKDELVLVSKKDVKIATPAWNTDMDEFFTQMLKLIEEVIKQNKNLEAAHKEIGKVAQTNAAEIHPTGVGPSGPPTSAGTYVASKAKSTSNASTTKTIRSAIEKIKGVIEKMKQ